VRNTLNTFLVLPENERFGSLHTITTTTTTTITT